MEMDTIQTQIQTELPFCRLCFSQACDLYELYPGAGNDNESLLLKILEVLGVAISFDEDLNSFICGKCVTTVEDFFEYKEKVKENDQLLREKRKSVDHATAIYNVVNMQPDATNSSASNGATGAGGGSELGAGGVDEAHVGLDQRISIDGGPPLNGNIIEFKKQLFTQSQSQFGIWLCVASGSDIQCPAAIEVDDNIQVVAEIGQHNHGLPVSVPENPPETTPTKQQQHQQQQQQQHQQQPPHHQQQQQHHHHHGQTQEHHQHDAEDTIVVTTDGSTSGILTSASSTPVAANSSSRGGGGGGSGGNKSSSSSTSSSKKKKSRDQPSKRKVSNDILVGDGWLTDVTTFKRNHYQLVTKDGYQTFLIYNGYRFRTQQKIRNGIAAWKCAWNGRKGCQAILHITEDYQKVREVGSPHNHEPSLRDRIISNKPTNGNTSDQSLIMQSDGEELGEMHKIVATTSAGGGSAGALAGETITLGGGATVVAITTTTNASANSNNGTATTATATTTTTTLDLTSEMEFVQQSSSSGSELITTTSTTTSTPGGSSSSAGDQQGSTHQHHQPQQQSHHHHHHHPHHSHEVVSVVDEVVGKDDTTMSMDIEEIIRPHVVLHPASE